LATFTLATIAFSAGAALKRTDLDALILIASPVAGLPPDMVTCSFAAQAHVYEKKPFTALNASTYIIRLR
jgi:hypothetical protein